MLEITIEAFRGLAACWVFLFHMDRPAGHAWTMALADLGALGVSMFFVISGYCIGAAAWKNFQRQEPPSAFLRRRLLRIYPPLWASMVVLIALPFLLGALSAIHTGHFAPPAMSWSGTSLAGWVELATLTRVFFSHGQALELAFTSFNAVYWTLAIEVQFYLVMYIALLFGKRGGSFLLAITVIGCGSALMPSAYNTGLFLPYWPLFAVGLALFRLVDAGVVPAAAFGRHHSLFAWTTLAGLASVLVVLILSGVLKAAGALHPLLLFFLFGLGFAAFLWFAIEAEPLLARMYASGSLVGRLLIGLALAVGSASYSIYLLHGKLFALPAMLTRHVLPNAEGARLALTMGLTIALAYLFSVTIERRFIRRRDRSPAGVATSDVNPLAKRAASQSQDLPAT